MKNEWVLRVGHTHALERFRWNILTASASLSLNSRCARHRVADHIVVPGVSYLIITIFCFSFNADE